MCTSIIKTARRSLAAKRWVVRHMRSFLSAMLVALPTSIFCQSLDGLVGAELVVKRNESYFTFVKGLDSANQIEVDFCSINILWEDPYRHFKPSVSSSGLFSFLAMVPFVDGGEFGFVRWLRPVALPVLLLNSKFGFPITEDMATPFSDRTNIRVFLRNQTDYYRRADWLVRASPGVGIEILSITAPPFKSAHKLHGYGFQFGVDTSIDLRKDSRFRHVETRFFLALRFSQHTL